jgi:UDP-2,3-diacylglucosamine pyrophosphatase LpxH
MIIIADAHVDTKRGNDVDFFLMLNALGKSNQDLVFLGDIFDLWIALPRYEKDIHEAFLAWCKEQKKYRSIGFVEGNHEYFVVQERKEHFSWASDKPMWQDDKGNLFCHGDLINYRDTNYLLFRRITKNKITKTIARFFPFGPEICESLKAKLKKTNLEFRKHIPEKEIAEFADRIFNENIHTIFAAHFHCNYHYYNLHSNRLHVIPAWMDSKQVTLWNEESKMINSYHWRDLDTVLADG